MKDKYIISNFIGGRELPPADGRYFDNVDPATGSVYGAIPDSGQQDLDQAVAAARKAFPEWSEMSDGERSKRLTALADLIGSHLETLALAESRDNGKPISLARTVDIPRAASNFRFFATAAMHFASESHETRGAAINYTLRRPIGIVGCISPWNLPLYLFTWKIAPALAAGNCVIAKPSEVTPMTAHLICSMVKEAGIPDGVLNILHGTGPGIGELIVKHPEIKAISFTGGTATGERIAATAGPMFKKLSLELGGKNPNIIFADCDYETMLETTLRSSFSNQGQICLCGSRILVESSLYERFRDDFVKRVSDMKVGDPFESGTNIGAVVSESHMNKVLGYIDLAREEGGTVLCGGHRVQLEGRCSDGYFIAPTVIEGLAHDCRTNTEEIFGPVVTIAPFNDEEEALKVANSVRYGLSTTIWTQHLTRAHNMALRLESGIVWVNCWMLRDLRTPFGGMKDSGVGREGGWEALRFFTEPKNVCIKY